MLTLAGGLGVGRAWMPQSSLARLGFEVRAPGTSAKQILPGGGHDTKNAVAPPLSWSTCAGTGADPGQWGGNLRRPFILDPWTWDLDPSGVLNWIQDCWWVGIPLANVQLHRMALLPRRVYR